MNQIPISVSRLLIRVILPVVLIIFAGITIAAPQDMDKIRISGTGSFMGSLRLLAKTFNESQNNVHAIVSPNLGSGGSLRALLAEGIDIAVLSRPLNEDEQRQDIVASYFARTPFVIVVPTTNQTNEVTRKLLLDIYGGKIKRWPDGERIRIILRREDDDHTELLKSFSPEMKSAVIRAENTKGALFAYSDEDSADYLEVIPGAIGISTLAAIKSERRSSKALKLNGINPTTENIANGTYPHQELFILVRKNNPSEPVKRFLDFINSEAGKNFFKLNGTLLN